MPEPEMLTVGEVAELLRLTPTAVYSQRHRGELPGVLGVKAGRRLLYRRSDIDRYFDQQIEKTLAGTGVA